MTAVTHMNEANNPFLMPGVKVKTTPTSASRSRGAAPALAQGPLGALRRRAVREAVEAGRPGLLRACRFRAVLRLPE